MEPKQVVIYLRPGEFYASSEPVVIKTVLGSCVSVCLHDKVNRVGGVNHYLLPHRKVSGENPMNYGETSIPELVNTVIRQGGNQRYFAAQLVGGSCLMASTILDVGKTNVEIARKILRELGIPITYEDVGGVAGRVIRFYPCTNELYVRPAGSDDRVEEVTSLKAPVENSVQLTAAQATFLTNLFTVALGKAQESLSTMLGEAARIAVSEVIVRKMDYVQEYTERKFANFLITTSQREQVPLGDVVMLMEPAKAAVIANLLLRRPASTPVEYNRLETSAIVEMANVVINAILGTLANHLAFAMMLKVPKIIKTKDELAALSFMQAAKQWKVSLGVKTSLTIPALGIDSLLLLLVELNSPYVFFQTLGTNE